MGDERGRAAGSTPPSTWPAAEFYLDRLDEASAHAEHALARSRARPGTATSSSPRTPIVGNIRLPRGDLRGATEFWDAAVEVAG